MLQPTRHESHERSKTSKRKWISATCRVRHDMTLSLPVVPFDSQSPKHCIYLAHPHTPSTQISGKSHWFRMLQCFKGTFLHGISFAHILVGPAHSVGTTAVGLGLVFDLMAVNKPLKRLAISWVTLGGVCSLRFPWFVDYWRRKGPHCWWFRNLVGSCTVGYGLDFWEMFCHCSRKKFPTYP